MRSAFYDVERTWVCLRAADSDSLLKDEKVVWGYGPTNRNYFNLLRNLCLAPFVLLKVRPDYIVSTGAGLAIPFFVLGRIFGCKTIFIESFARQNELSLTGRVLYRISHIFIVQNEELAKRYDRAVYRGVVY